jgi:Nucleolar protein 12 (25kDa)
MTMPVGMHISLITPLYPECMTLHSREFLTGFHKRKLAKKEEGKKKAQAREKQDLREARREVRTVCTFESHN